jgi:hypothetical protein
MSTEIRDPHAATTAEENQSVTTSDPSQQQAENYPENPEQSNTPTNFSIQSNRSNMVSLYIMGNVNDAKAMFVATPGATESGWSNFERTLAPVRDFVVMGNLPYTQTWTGEYTGIANDIQEQRDAAELQTAAGGTMSTSGGSSGSPKEVTLGTTTGQTVQAVQQERASGDVETTPLPGAQPTQTSTRTSSEKTEQTKDTETGARAGGYKYDQTWAAMDLINAARVAKKTEELDAIEDAANGRVTVLDAVDARREELAK